MARKTPTKQQKLNKQYRDQLRRIEKNYRNIERRGGMFSQSLDDIIRPVKKPTEATIRRLRSISKDELYRLAKTETGESGWKIRAKDIEIAQGRAIITKYGNKQAERYYGKDWKEYYPKEQWNEIREESVKQRGEELLEWIHQGNEEAQRYEEPEEPYQWVQSEPEPVITPPEPEQDYPQDDYEDDYSSEQGSMQDYRDNLKDNIENVLSNNQDSTFLNGLKNMFNDMVNNMTDDELSEWLYEKGQAFYEAIQDVEKYNPTITHTGNGLKRFNEAVDMMNNGITPLDKFENPMVDSGSGSYLPKSNEQQNNQYSSRKYTDGEWTALVDTTTGEIFWGREESVLVKVNKWGNPIYETKWFDEHGLTVDYGGHIFPLSEVEDNEDYFR